MTGEFLSFVIRLVAPTGEVYDVTDRTFQGSIGTLTEALEEDLVAFTHDDLELSLDDRDGYITELFRFAQPSDAWELWIDRETGYRRPRYQREFGGVLDLPWSLRREAADETVTVRAFAYSKLLEQTSAESIVRTVAGRTGQVTSGSATVTVSSTTDIHRGDEVALDDGDNHETRTVLSVDSSTQLTTTETWSRSFASGSALELETPFYRNRSAAWLASKILETAGVEAQDIDLSQALVSFPFASPLNDHDVPGGQTPTGLTVAGGEVALYSGGDRYTAANLIDGFTDDGTVTTAGDWTPYMDTEPGTIETGLDDATRAYDHTGGYVYTLKVTVVAGTSSKLELEQDGVVVKLIDNYLSDDGYPWQAVEFTPTTGDVVVSYRRGNLAAEATRAYETSGWTSTTTLAVAQFYHLRTIQRLGQLALYDPDDDAFELRTLSAGYALERTLTPPPSLYAWTLRAFGNSLVGLYRDGAKTAARVWDTRSFESNDYPVAPTTSSRQYLTRWTDAAGTEILVGCAGGEYFALSDTFEGVIPYADFDGLSCGGALVELAKASMAYFDVTPAKLGIVRGRAYEMVALSDPAELPTPHDREDLQLWQDYSTSVQVAGEDRTGDDVEALAGDTGDSSHRAEIDSKLVQTEAVAFAVASKYYAWLSQQRGEAQVTVPEPTPRARPMEQRQLDGRTYSVISADTALEDREQSLRMVEA